MDRLINLYNIASPSGREKRMAEYIVGELERMGAKYKKDRNGNIYAVKGRAGTYPCVIAHIDEVHCRKTGTYGAYLVGREMIVGYDHRHCRQTGIGADDKNGIWICLKAMESFKRMKCVFFVQEETGCIGSNHADMDFFSDCRFVIQCDRKGNGDIITRIGGIGLCSKEFLDTIQPERFGYRTCGGLSTDVYALKTNGLEVSCVNLSCGYYNPHTDSEFTIWKDLLKCFRFVCHIIKAHKAVSPHLPERPAFPRFGWLGEDDCCSDFLPRFPLPNPIKDNKDDWEF